MKSYLFAGLIAATCALAGTTFGQVERTMLDDVAVAKLTPEAKTWYAQAVEFSDKVNLDEAIKALSQAAAADPENVDLQFLTAKLARERADRYYGSASYTQIPELEYAAPFRTADPYIEIVEECVQRLLTNSKLTTEQHERLQTALAVVQKRKQDIGARDDARRETALSFVLQIRQQRREERGLDDLALTADQAGFDPTDPETALLASQGIKTSQEKEVVTGPKPGEFVPTDPFKPLQGEYIKPFLPPPPTPVQGYGQGEQLTREEALDPFATAPGGEAPPPVQGPPPDNFGGK